MIPNFAYEKVTTFIQMNREEAQKLFDCAVKVPKDGVIVEIGTFKGGSAIIMAEATEAIVYTIDIENQATENIKDYSNIKFIHGDSEEVSKTWDKEIDMIFIDGSHFYADVRRDITNWLPKLKERGIVCFHDYGSHVDVTTAVNEALIQRIGMPNNSLLTIIK